MITTTLKKLKQRINYRTEPTQKIEYKTLNLSEADLAAMDRVLEASFGSSPRRSWVSLTDLESFMERLRLSEFDQPATHWRAPVLWRPSWRSPHDLSEARYAQDKRLLQHRVGPGVWEPKKATPTLAEVKAIPRVLRIPSYLEMVETQEIDRPSHTTRRI